MKGRRLPFFPLFFLHLVVVSLESNTTNNNHERFCVENFEDNTNVAPCGDDDDADDESSSSSSFDDDVYDDDDVCEQQHQHRFCKSKMPLEL